VFPNTPVANWQTSTIAYQSSSPWYVAGDNGNSTYSPALSGGSVRLVRSDGVDAFNQAACGPANGHARLSAPTTGLCSSGNPSALAGNGPWTWTCSTPTGTVLATCAAPYGAQEQFSVAANVFDGTSFTNPSATAPLTCTVTATGQWNNGPTATYGPDGATALPLCGAGCKFPNAPSVSLNMLRTNGASQYIGSSATITLAANETVAFANNDGIGAYGDNGGSVTVTVTCQPPQDTTPPTLSAVSATATTLTATSDEAATGYWIVLAAGTAAPTAAQVKSYAVNGAAGVLARGTGAMTANVAKTFAVTGLSANTVYDFYIVAEDTAGNLSVRGSTQNAVDAACASSTVATVQLVNLTDKMIAAAAQAFGAGNLRSTINVTCANGRFGVVRLPGLISAAVGGNAYALVQSSCPSKSVQRIASPAATVVTMSDAWAKRNDQAALMADALFGPLARWVCE